VRKDEDTTSKREKHKEGKPGITTGMKHINDYVLSWCNARTVWAIIMSWEKGVAVGHGGWK
jgi:hypothetical protein